MLEANLAYVTPSTVWLMQQSAFWQLPQQQSLRLKASFTVYDRFEGNTGHLVHMMALLKTPKGLADAWLKATIKGRSPLTWKEVDTKYWAALSAVGCEAELLQVKDHHLLDWAGTLFGNKPLDSGKSLQECWRNLILQNKDVCSSVTEECPAVPEDFLLATHPRLLPNQRAITLLAKELASQKNNWVYVAQPTGTGKTTEMLEIGYLMALDCLPATGKTVITV